MLKGYSCNLIIDVYAPALLEVNLHKPNAIARREIDRIPVVNTTFTSFI